LNLGHDKKTVLFQGIPGIYLLLLCDVIKQLGMDEQAIIHDMGVTRGELLRPDSRITMKMGHIAAQRGTALAGDLGLGMAYAQALKVLGDGLITKRFVWRFFSDHCRHFFREVERGRDKKRFEWQKSLGAIHIFVRDGS